MSDWSPTDDRRFPSAGISAAAPGGNQRRPGGDHHPVRRVVPAILAATLLLLAAGCGGDDGDEFADLTPRQREGLELMRDKGCRSCHGDGGSGGIAPPWTGLVGSEVELADGSVITADRAYLERAITEPQADVVAGYTIRMPKVDLTDDELDAVIAFIESR
jgi:cytochrome c oxidase subunit 2